MAKYHFCEIFLNSVAKYYSVGWAQICFFEFDKVGDTTTVVTLPNSKN